MRLIDADELLNPEYLRAFPAFEEKLADTTDLRDIVASCKTIRDVPDCYIVKIPCQEEMDRLLQVFRKENCFISLNNKEATTMQVTYNGFTGELVKLERKGRDTTSPHDYVSPYLYDISINSVYAEGKTVTHSFTGVKLEDLKFSGGEVSFK